MSQALFGNALEFAAAQARRVIDMHPGYVPMYTVGGKWNREGERWTHWCEGFYPGIYWLLHKHTGERFWREQAEKYTVPLAGRRFDRSVHDLGFLFFSTYGRWYRLTGDPALKQILIDAGRTLALRRQAGGYLASFLGPQSLFIDIMMNVGIIFWAANATGDDALRQIALEHCRTTQKYLIRSDGGTAHEGIFDTDTGQFLRESTQQGYSPDSTWTRGLAWAIYGFTAVHRLSGVAEFLKTAQHCADCYLRRAPANLVPPWDFDAPEDFAPVTKGEQDFPPRTKGEQDFPPLTKGGQGGVLWPPLTSHNTPPGPPFVRGGQLLDSSAAAITASGLLDLSEQVDGSADKKRYRQAALKILEALCGEAFLAHGRAGWEGILLHGVYHYHKNLGVDESVAWGDFFFVEALIKVLAGNSEAAW